MDILEYAARKNVNDLNTCINTFIPGTFYQGCLAAATTANNDGALWTTNFGLYSDYQRQGGTTDFWIRPWCTSTWSRIPTMPGGTQCTAGTNPATSAEYCGFKVCATNFTQGATCTWTVPSGVTVARFQLWGAGGRSGSGCCCGGSTWGQNGAYASIIIPVVAGCQYTLTAACACRTPVLWGSMGGSYPRANPTSVTGFGLCNLCAMSGQDAAHWCQMAYDQAISIWTSGCCRWTAGDCFTGGSCICNTQSDFCHQSCASCGCLPMSCSNTTRFFGCYTGSLTSDQIQRTYGSQVAGIPGLNGGMCWDSSFNGLARAPSIYGYNQLCAEYCVCYGGSTTGGQCCNHIGYDYRRLPGAGGTMVALYAGCTTMCDPTGNLSCGGDIGRSGMVCVTFA